MLESTIDNFIKEGTLDSNSCNTWDQKEGWSRDGLALLTIIYSLLKFKDSHWLLQVMWPFSTNHASLQVEYIEALSILYD